MWMAVLPWHSCDNSIIPAMRILLFLILTVAYIDALAQASRHRVLVLTDIEADPDDTQSLIRFLLYSNQWDVAGIIATTSIHQKTSVYPASITRIIEEYAKVRPNLLLHEPGFPDADLLKTKVKQGLPVYGMTGVGETFDSEGSNWIVQELERDDPRPLWISVWGGPNCLAQALYRIKKTKSKQEAERLFLKIRVYTISDQDDSGPWIRKNFPELFYIVTPGYNYTYATWLGMSFPFPGSNSEVTTPAWLAENIQQGKGPLGAAYPDTAYGMEGDTPAFLNLIDNGLSNPEHPDLGGWGGRYEYYLPPFRDSNTGRFKRNEWPKDEPETRAIWTNATDSVVSLLDKKKYGSEQATLWRWREEIQNDFAARMSWCTLPLTKANHPPIPKLNHAERLEVKSGAPFELNAAGSKDPDGDSMSYYWLYYAEAGSFRGNFSFAPYAPNMYRIPCVAPKVNKEETLHFVLKVADKGKPALTRYKRVIVHVKP